MRRRQRERIRAAIGQYVGGSRAGKVGAQRAADSLSWAHSVKFSYWRSDTHSPGDIDQMVLTLQLMVSPRDARRFDGRRSTPYGLAVERTVSEQ